MRDQTAAFVTELRGRVEITLRPSPNDYAMRTAEMLRAIDNSLAIDNPRIPGVQSYVGSGLVVHNYLGTAWLETLALNIPTVCFFDPETYDFRGGSLDLIRSLKSVGILHECGREAAHFVLAVKDRMPSWWKKADVQTARCEFVGRYAALSTNWLAVWENELTKKIW
jgi:putative transferase (TIGR04331 family)